LIQNALISIIVPAYNVKGYIERTLESICKQSYQNLEIIVVDDGSTDGTQDVIKKVSIKDNRIHAYFKANEGVTKARLDGVRRANGEWVGFVDADDVLSPDMYMTLYTNAIQYEAEISHCGYQMAFPNRTVKYYGTERLVEQDRAKGLNDLLEGAFIEPSLCNKLFKRDLFEGIWDWIDLTIKNYEDLLMNYYLFSRASKSVFFDACLYRYILRKNSAATANLNIHKLKGPINVLKIIKQDLQNKGSNYDIVDARIVGCLLQILSISKRNCSSEIWEFCKTAKIELKSIRKTLKGNKHCSNKLKIMAFLAVNFTWGYRLLRHIYSKIVRTDKKYRVE
jgi:glycosyltransferase involved in cell wall biosynthesis